MRYDHPVPPGQKSDKPRRLRCDWAPTGQKFNEPYPTRLLRLQDFEFGAFGVKWFGSKR